MLQWEHLTGYRTMQTLEREIPRSRTHLLGTALIGGSGQPHVRGEAHSTKHTVGEKANGAC